MKGRRLLLFTAKWCRACSGMYGMLEQMTKDILNLYVDIIDIEKQPKLAEKYHVTSLPKFVLLDENDEVIKVHSGIIAANELRGWFQ